MTSKLTPRTIEHLLAWGNFIKFRANWTKHDESLMIYLNNKHKELVKIKQGGLN